MSRTLRTVLDGLAFAEGPRWRDDRLWFSDMHSHTVMTVTPEGKAETHFTVAQQPSGLGWMPDGRLLVVSMVDRKLLRQDGPELVEHADLSDLAKFHCNDMVVDAAGGAYVGNFGFDLDAQAKPETTELIRVEADGSARIVADEMRFPNGAVITPDGETLIVGESFGGCLTAFDIGANGDLSNRRVFAQLEGAVPDGICLDAEGAVWAASPVSNEVIRVREGGQVEERLPTETQAIACMLGGADRRTLFVLTAETTAPDEAKAKRSAKILATEVDVAGAGLP